jgi:putative membrane protein
MKHLYIYLKGIAIGIANVIPGVSGGTMAFILGIYKQLTDAIGNFATDKENRLKYLVLLILIAFGAGTGIILFAKFFSFMLEDAVLSQYTFAFFIGLIIGSIPFIISLHKDMKVSAIRLGVLILAVVLVLSTALLGSESMPANQYEITGEILGVFKLNEITFSYGVWLFVCGIMAAGSMVLPGFSGSALLISLGEYNNILYFVDNRMIIPVIVVMAGAIIGIILFAKVISWLLEKFPSNMYYFIIGLLIASVYQIYAEAGQNINTSTSVIIISILSMAAGFFVSYLLSKIQK